MFDKQKEKAMEKILEKYKDSVGSVNDLTAGEEPTMLFFLLIKLCGYLLENDPEKVTSKQGVEIRKYTSKLIRKVGPLVLQNKQIIENRNELLHPGQQVEEDKGIILPEEPVIWAPNHAFKDDTLATITSIYRNAYIMFGSIPQFYNTFDGITAWANGVAMTNRKVKESKRSTVAKSVAIINNGADLLMFPEGVWNKTPNRLLIDLWPGIYLIAKETGIKVVPVAHYMRDCAHLDRPNNEIHTVIDNPIRIDDMPQKEALEYLRDKIATWEYLMMEKYGQSTREEELKGFANPNEAWEEHLNARVGTVGRYDKEIELCADYRPKDIIRPEDVFKPIADLTENENNEIKQMVKTLMREDYQRRF